MEIIAATSARSIVLNVFQITIASLAKVDTMVKLVTESVREHVKTRSVIMMVLAKNAHLNVTVRFVARMESMDKLAAIIAQRTAKGAYRMTIV